MAPRSRPAPAAAGSKSRRGDLAQPKPALNRHATSNVWCRGRACPTLVGLVTLEGTASRPPTLRVVIEGLATPLSGCPSANLLSRCDFSKTQCEKRFAGDTEVRRFFGINNGEYLGFATARARSGGTGRFGFGRHRERIRQFTHLGGFELEGRIAVVADMVETTRWLAGVKNILRPALRAGNGNGGKPHRSSEWRSATGAVKLHGFTRGLPRPSQ